MIAAMAGFAIEDALLKGVSSALPIAQVLVFFGLGGATIFASIALFRGEKIATRDIISLPMRIRVVFEISGRLFYLLALALLPLSTVTVILQATPIIVVAAAALIFHEHVGWRRWAAILLGMSGVLVILQPGTGGFSILSLLAVAGMLGFAGRDLASRAAPTTISTNILGFYGFFSIVAAGLIVSVWAREPFLMPSGKQLVFLATAMACGVFAYFCLMKAMRTGEISAVTPFRYTRLIFGIALGIALFDERLSPSTITGSLMIVLSGLFILWRGQKHHEDSDIAAPNSP